MYDGFVAETVDDVGTTTTVAKVLSNGNRVASTDAAPKSCIKDNVMDPLFNPPIRSRNVPPNAVVVSVKTARGAVEVADPAAEAKPAAAAAEAKPADK